ncbi:MAG: methyltransferase domain-containing protein, partial [Thermonemataceae bacterium]|nr:methyltransferase domain-containing protein [Thermonemataceae bacterium]
IPGCGNAHEANYLAELGFQDITLIDYAPLLVEQLKEKFAQKTAIKVIESDFFELNGQYDLIVEQTFFCAISPELRQRYAKKMYDLLKPQAKLVGLLFNRTFEQQGPPFGGCTEEYLAYFLPYFHIKTFENSYNSISPRANTEIFMILQRKSETQLK